MPMSFCPNSPAASGEMRACPDSFEVQYLWSYSYPGTLFLPVALLFTCCLISNITQELLFPRVPFSYARQAWTEVPWAPNRVPGFLCGPAGHPLKPSSNGLILLRCFSFFFGFPFFSFVLSGEGPLPGMAIVLGNEPPGLVNKLHFIPPCHFWLGEHQEMKAETSKALLLT